MSSISIIGTGGMATAISSLAARAGHSVEVISRDASKAQALADQIGGDSTVGAFGSTPAGDIVVLAVPYAVNRDVAKQFGANLAGKVIIDVSNTFTADATDVVTPAGTSGAEELAKALPADAKVVKAFNAVFGHVLAQGRPLDVLIAGDDAPATASVSSFIQSLGLRPLNVGGLGMARWLEGVGPILMGLARHGLGSFNLAIEISTRD
ncbi:MAG TPA: NAD(P)-binding domain-containing protein [Lacisediminihabitans sp.]|jgi:predicted dinucleotide-binding enzyme|nr:NAD(P)-binding domain-containing protein [Lacisediminihabitans sp.]HXD60405.1 NAD(P)-binding domain-containing protein [Lacisediminihabitans sp.]